MIGKTLAHYEITSQLGKGGMGEVYQAKDTKLGRSVAIKVLPEEFAKDADRVARFQREAKLLASLNHPNIAAIHGLEEADGTNFLVMELIEGQTLDDRIKVGAIPVEETLKLALQIAEALEAAHEKGVIHRDLKPANIKVTPDGKVKVLDFGLAKAYAGEQDQMNLSNSSTLSDAATQQCVILGTAAYMSPEQARGKPVDKRTDVWAFGCVLYEMLTGKAAFQGEDVTEILAAVVKSGVNLDLLPANIHFRVREVIIRCLQKEQKKRYGGIGEAHYEIEQVLVDPSGVFAQPITAEAPQKKLRTILPWVAAAIVVAGVVGWILKPAPPTEPRYVHRYPYDLPEDQEFTGGSYGKCLAISSDGTMIVYVGNEQLYLKKSNELTASPIRGSDENPTHPFFSPKGEWIGYYSLHDRQWKKILIRGGSSLMLCDPGSFYYPTWVADDMILFGGRGRITLVSPNKGTTEEIITGEEDELLAYPQILPGGKAVLYTLYAEEGEESQFAVQSLDAEEAEFQLPGGPAQYLPTGHIVFGSGNTLRAIRFNPDTLEIIGGPITLIEDVFRVGPNLMMQLAISDSGTLAYIPRGTVTTTQIGTLVWVDREGNEELIDDTPRDYIQAKISPDGKRVALTIIDDENTDIWIYDLARKTLTMLTHHETHDIYPIWTHDGKQIIFGSRREGEVRIFSKAAGGTGQAAKIVQMEDSDIAPRSISEDDKTLLFDQAISDNVNIGTYSMDGEHIPEFLLEEEYYEGFPQISPDGQWLAYTSDESGQFEVYIRPFPDVNSGDIKPVSTDGGLLPLWCPPYGKELFYVRPSSNELMVVSVETDPELELGDPQRLFKLRPYPGFFDIDPEGKRFLMIKRVELTEDDLAQFRLSRKVIIVTNWFEELKERVPVE